MMKKILITAVVLLATLYGIWQLSSARSYQLFGELVHRVDTNDKVIALTFDDGPSKRYTDQVLAILSAEQVTATFFVTGKETKQNLPQARQLLAAGHQLGNHSYNHPRMLLMSPTAVASEIEQTDAAIRSAGYKGDILFRPPYGKKLLVLPWYLAKHNRTTIMWDLEPETDPKLANNAQSMVAYVINNAKPGSIVLLHVMYQSRQASREALPQIIQGLKQKGYRFVTVDELLAAGSKAKPA
ncbi:peptidoglycan/xylan/chitin deacetylase (PgdA/CDA1 family) [Rheinheimera pacifica]|uniref:polysaccharide deacetylase family protein n=1 Tax=Rheinheimera pacifica TaxID=173990 RepID=UPI002856D219|nr:polysaccharide deacetylase family protein [Rheinheimera pacifica]MDR6982236.1 peptidoglycan/xylan/chitin deacetylase (PgdA/CDA1 family) [Rheinheimera pacifica]